VRHEPALNGAGLLKTMGTLVDIFNGSSHKYNFNQPLFCGVSFTHTHKIIIIISQKENDIFGFRISRFVGHKPNTFFYAGYRLFTHRQYCDQSEFWAISFISLPDFRAENKIFPLQNMSSNPKMTHHINTSLLSFPLQVFIICFLSTEQISYHRGM
jgi:hypothetical protein